MSFVCLPGTAFGEWQQAEAKRSIEVTVMAVEVIPGLRGRNIMLRL